MTSTPSSSLDPPIRCLLDAHLPRPNGLFLKLNFGNFKMFAGCELHDEWCSSFIIYNARAELYWLCKQQTSVCSAPSFSRCTWHPGVCAYLRQGLKSQRKKRHVLDSFKNSRLGGNGLGRRRAEQALLICRPVLSWRLKCGPTFTKRNRIRGRDSFGLDRVAVTSGGGWCGDERGGIVATLLRAPTPALVADAGLR